MIVVLKEFVDSKGGKPSKADFFEELRMQQLAKVFDNKVRLFIAFEVLCGSSMDAKALSGVSELIDKVISSPKLPARDVLWALDAYLQANPGVSKGFAMMLKVAYDEDWAEEKEILSYYQEDEGVGEPGFDEAKKLAAPFLTWLEKVDSEEDDDDDDDDEDDD